MRLLILILLAYFGYRLLKKVAGSGQPGENLNEVDDLSPVDDVMVKDPFCEVYLPREKGVKDVIEGKTYYFCSLACRDKFLEAMKHSKS